MDLSTLTVGPETRQDRKRVGRGPSSGKGKTAGKGHKGSKARAGYARKQGFEGGQMPLHRRLPKRGFRHYTRHPYAVVNLDVLNEKFEDGAVITLEALVAANILEPQPAGLKVLGRGEVTKKLTLKVQAITPGAQSKVEQAGGTVEVVAVAVAEAE